MWKFIHFLQNNGQDLLVLTREHIFLVLVSTSAAILIGVPLGVLLTRIKSLRTPVLGFANIMQTVPSLALWPVDTDSVYRRHRCANGHHRTRPLCVAACHSQHRHRNLGHRPKTIEAADAIGMTGWQV